MKKGFRELAAVFCLVVVLLTAGDLFAGVDSKGTEFWIGFMNNYGALETKSLIITSEAPAFGTISVQGLAWSTTFTTTPGTTTTMILPAGARASSFDGAENTSVHVVSDNDITIYGLSQYYATTDAYLALPVDAISTSYIVASYGNGGAVAGTGFMVVASQDNTTITIIPSVTIGSRNAGVPYNIVLSRGQLYQLMSTGALENFSTFDLTGTLITSDKPVSVFGGHGCANIPADVVDFFCCCDHIIEQLPPVTAWGKQFLGMPLATRTQPDTFVIIASQNGTNVTFNGTALPLLNKGQKIQQRTISGPVNISANKPILAVQYSNSTEYDDVAKSDPFMMLLLPVGQYQTSYTVSTPSNGITDNYFNLVVPSYDIASVNLDGSLILASAFTAISGSGYYGAQIPVSIGVHNISAPSPFGVYVYGFDVCDSYGYPGGCGVENLLNTRTVTPTRTYTLTSTYTPTRTPTSTITETPTRTGTRTITMTCSITPTWTETPEPLKLTSPGSFPNPFIYDTQLIYWLSVEADISIKIYTVSGETVFETKGIAGLVGNNSFYWDGKNSSKKSAASGVYICRISAVSKRNEHARVFIKVACVK